MINHKRRILRKIGAMRGFVPKQEWHPPQPEPPPFVQPEAPPAFLFVQNTLLVHM